MSIGRFLFDLLFPPRCIACRSFCKKDLLDPCEAPFCEKCRLEWEREKTVACANCGRELLSCRCSSGRMEKAGVSESLKLVFYQSEKDTVGRRAVLYLKKNRNRRAFDFFAEQLSFPIRRYMNEKGFTAEDIRFCHVPRFYKSTETYGLDQAEQLSRALSKRWGSASVPLFYRDGAISVEQKTLSAGERAKNAQKLFRVNEDQLARLGDVKCLFLVDDVITTGASVSACAKLLGGRYCGETVAVSLARTPLLRRKIPKKDIKI